MIPEPAAKNKSLLKDPFFYGSCLIFFILLYVGWIFFSRWQQNRVLQRKTLEQRTERQREQDRATLEQLGGSALAIQSFYVSPGIVHRGESAQLCYGVANAKTITLDPPVARVWPSYSRCFDVTPSKTTTYTLTITGPTGDSQSASVVLKVD